ncbi:MAG: hypothetical protein CO093_09820 [Alphaproteobacteria bacterium CG_4_9_14_3_um_filter_47_13]|nr:MAG: hypothetical protein CO093_09820 [Alphaproteobacteria bacterium CG_4_9_14_3_um_filter_47_13]
MSGAFLYRFILASIFSGFFNLVILGSCLTQAQDFAVYTPLEKAGFAFYRLANFPPDFKTWIIHSPRYQTASPLERVEMIRHDVYRLRNGYSLFRTDVDLIPLSIPARINTPANQAATLQNDQPVLLTLSMDKNFENYIPLKVGEVWIALVIKGHDKITHLKVTPREYRRMRAQGALENDIEIKLQLRAVSVDTTRPLILNGTEMWLMFVEVAGMNLSRLVSGETETLWTLQIP